MLILQWNIRSVLSNYNNLLINIETYKPDIIALTETFLKTNKVLTIKNYNIFRNDRGDSHGGLAFLVKCCLPAKVKTINNLRTPDRFQFSVLSVGRLNLINIYSPPDVRLEGDLLLELASLFQNNTLMIGDFNAQSPSWGSGTLNPNGAVVERFLEAGDMVLLNDGASTRVVSPSQQASAPDLTFCSSDMALETSWRVLPDPGFSDHLPIAVGIDDGPLGIQTRRRFITTKKFDVAKGEWDTYSQEVINLLNNSDPTDLKGFNQLLVSAAEKTFPTIPPRTGNSKFRLPWWDEDLKHVICDRRSAYRLYVQEPTRENFVEARRCGAKARREVRAKKRKSFQEFCENIDLSKNPNIWKSIKKFNGTAAPDAGFMPPTEVIREIMDNLTPVQIPLSMPQAYSGTAMEPFTKEELDKVLELRKDTAPGLDSLTFAFYKHLPAVASSKLLTIYNNMLLDPECTREQNDILILPVQKKGRDPSQASSFRPISLITCGIKVLEGLIKERIEPLFEASIPPSRNMYGFRRGKSVQDCLTCFTLTIYREISCKNFVVAAFVDIKSAYDHVNFELLGADLCSLEVPDQLVQLILALNRNRRLYTKDEESSELLGPWLPQSGVSQGSKVGPTLFNVYVSRLADAMPVGVEVGQFVDDVYLLCSGEDLDLVVDRMNIALESLNGYLRERQLPVAVDKTSVMAFGRRRLPLHMPAVHLAGVRVPWVNKAKYLGVMYDSKLLWRDHVDTICGRALQGINAMKALCRTWWGSRPSVLISLYKALVRPHLEYGTFLIGKCSSVLLARLNRVQYSALRVALGLMRSTPTNVILNEAGEVPLSNRRVWLAGKFLSRALRVVDSPVVDIVQDLAHRDGFWGRRVRPAIITAYSRLSGRFGSVWREDVLPCFTISAVVHADQPRIKHSGLQKGSVDAGGLFAEMCARDYAGYRSIFTDASVDAGAVGLGVFSSDFGISFRKRLPDHWDICTAEMAAIGFALNYILSHDVSSVLVVTDSLSSLQKLRHWKNTARLDILSVNVKKMLYRAKQRNLQVVLLWVPSHSGIAYNDRADALANEGRQLPRASSYRGDPRLLWPAFRQELMMEWDSEWREIGRTKGVLYTHYTIEERRTEPYWLIRERALPRKMITTMSRLRSGHCCIPTHLHKIGVVDDELCTCGSPGSLSHIFFDCSDNRPNCDTLYRELSKLGVHTPIQVYDIIFGTSQEVLQVLFDFIAASQLKM